MRSRLFIVTLVVALFGALTIFADTTKQEPAAVFGSAKVDGLACPFCAHGLKKKLDAVSWIESVTILVDDGLAKFTVKEGKTPDTSELKKAIADGGFSPGSVSLTAHGTVKTTKEAVYLVVNKDVKFVLDANKQRDKLLKEKDIKNRMVHIEGKAKTSADTTHIAIEKYVLRCERNGKET